MNIFVHQQVHKIVNLFPGASLNHIESENTNVNIEVEGVWKVVQFS